MRSLELSHNGNENTTFIYIDTYYIRMRKEIRLSQDEYNKLLTGAKLREDKLAVHIRKCALKQNEEYLKYMVQGRPLSERMKE